MENPFTNGFWLTEAFALFGLLMLVFNARFRRSLFATTCMMFSIAFIPLLFLGVIWLTFGPAGALKALSFALELSAQLAQAAMFSLFQIFIMFWAMGRPQVDIYLPEDQEAAGLDWCHFIGDAKVLKEAKKMVSSLKNQKRYAKYGTKPANGAILYGPPGTGKSLIARIIARKAGVPVFIVSSATLNGPFVAMGMLIVKSLCAKVRRYARKYKGAVVFLDEIDAVGGKRGGGTNALGLMGGMMGGGSNGTLQTLLTEMSGASEGTTWLTKLKKRWGLMRMSTKKPCSILWLSATNVDLDSLDDALMRSGRLGSIKLYVGKPTPAQREQLFRLYAQRKPLEPEVPWEQLAQLSNGLTGADIEETIEQAARSVIFELPEDYDGPVVITFKDILSELRFKKFGNPSAVPLNEKDKDSTKYHEGAHAAAMIDFAATGMICTGATLVPRDRLEPT
jgi:cell division protease FtsH